VGGGCQETAGDGCGKNEQVFFNSSTTLDGKMTCIVDYVMVP